MTQKTERSPSTDWATLHAAVADAPDVPGVLAALARLGWRLAGRAGAPAVPTEENLSALLSDGLSPFLMDDMSNARAESLRRVEAISEPIYEKDPFTPGGGERATFNLAPWDVHQQWLKYANTMKHPFAPLVEAWLRRAVKVAPFVPVNKASLPRLDRVTTEEASSLPLFSHERGGHGQPVLKTLDGSLPVFNERFGVNPSWLLSLFDEAAGKSNTRGGTGAPWNMHLFIGALLHIPVMDRGGLVALPFSTPQIIRWFHEDRWKHRGRDWPMFVAALDSLGSLRVTIPGVGRVGLVYARVIPETWDDGRGVVFETRIPYSASGGARIDWPTLCSYRCESPALYRAYLSVCAMMDRSAHKGHPITREIHPPVLLPSGKPKRRKGGRIVRNETALVPNRAERFVEAVSDAELARWFGYKAPAHRESRKRARQLLERLEADGLVAIERLKGGRFRLFGPAPSKSLIR